MLSGSCPSWRVLFALELKGLAYEAKVLDRSKGENRAADILAMNPRGKVPILRDGDVTLYESMAIVAYLEAQYPKRPVLGRSPAETGLVWRTWSEVVCYLEPALDRICIPIYMGKAAERVEEVRTAAHNVAAELAPLEERLTRAPWLAGDEPTAADGALVPQIGHALRACSKPIAQELDLALVPFDTRFPAITSWWQRCNALPNFERTTPPHWR